MFQLFGLSVFLSVGSYMLDFLSIEAQHNAVRLESYSREDLIVVIWVMMPCSLVESYQHFEGVYSIQLKERRDILNVEVSSSSEKFISICSLHCFITQQRRITILP
jgi:hypothetical protein